jgi:hypothetical protein
MKRHLILTLIAGVLLGAGALLPVSAQAQQMNYQGRLTTTNGAPLTDGQYNLTFSVYAAASGGSPLWGPFVCDGNVGPGHAGMADLVSGRFNVILGPVDNTSRSLPAAFLNTGGQPRYLGIRVNTGAEIAPRQQMLAAPEALHAAISDTVTNGAIGTAQIADGSITAAKISGGTGVWVGNGQDIYHLNGNVGIGTASPAATLDVNGNANISGNVGIGTASPAARLHVAGSGWFGADSGGLPSSAGAGVRLFYDTVTVAGQIYAYNYGTAQGADLALQGPGGNVGIGTTAPAAKLDVHGDVKLGPSGEYYAPAAEENLRILRGWATANTLKGAVNGPYYGVGSGFTYVAVSQGVVDVTFNTPFAGAPCVTANPITTGGIIIQMEAKGGGGVPTPSGFRANILDLSGNGRDWPFNFIAIGPR